MRPLETELHKIAVVRVEVRDWATRDLLIQLLEVGQERGSDRLLGSATSTRAACRVLAAWLGDLTNTSASDTD